jgi:hypothetical protein
MSDPVVISRPKSTFAHWLEWDDISRARHLFDASGFNPLQGLA